MPTIQRDRNGIPIPPSQDTDTTAGVVCPLCLSGVTARLKITKTGHYTIFCQTCASRSFYSNAHAEALARAWQSLLRDEAFVSALAERLRAEVERDREELGLQAVFGGVAGDAAGTS